LKSARVPLAQDKVYLKVDCNFDSDQASFYYSLDGAKWTQIGDKVQMVYTFTKHFMGYRFGLFNYATKTAGGYVDFDFYRVSDQLTK
jgi:beta-xylosidase